MATGPDNGAISIANTIKIKKYRFDINKAKDGQFYWTFHNTAGNTEAIAQSETYASKQSCKESIRLLQDHCESATMHEPAASF